MINVLDLQYKEPLKQGPTLMYYKDQRVNDVVFDQQGTFYKELFEVSDGLMRGIHILFYPNSAQIDKITMMKDGQRFGVEKHYSVDGTLKNVAVVFYNIELKNHDLQLSTTTSSKDQIIEEQREYPLIQELLLLPLKELIDFKFNSDSPDISSYIKL